MNSSVKKVQAGDWPPLPYQSWKDTLDTLHMWMQIVGKVKLALSPFLNQWWEVAFYVTPRGMTTGRIPYKYTAFSVDFDFINHTMAIVTSTKERTIPLTPRSVAQFYKEFFAALKELDIQVVIHASPVEFLHPIPFRRDTKHRSYDKESVTNWWRVQLHVSFVFDQFRSSFRGKSSPIHFFWGSFDLAGTRFSGKKAEPPHLQGVMGKIMKYSENEENFTFGFWPGDEKFPHPAFFSYIYPAPKGFETIHTGPSISYFNKKLSLCILPYEKLRTIIDPEKQILNFLDTTYKESAKTAGWNVTELENNIPKEVVH